MYNIGIVGSGKWAKVVAKNIILNKHFNLNSISYNGFDKKDKHFSNLSPFSNFRSMIDSNNIDCIYVAADPTVNLDVFEYSKKKKMPLILEKPLSNSFYNSKSIEKYLLKEKFPVLVNLPNIYSETFEPLSKLINNNKKKIKKIIIFEGNHGPFREKIHPTWDWGSHSISLVIKLLNGDSVIKIKKKEIKIDKFSKNRLVCRIDLLFKSGIKVKIIIGNLFKKKIRKLKVFLENNDFLESNMITGNMFYNNKLINKFNSNSLKILLDKFYLNIKYGYQCDDYNNIQVSSQSIRILESLYNY